MADKRYRIITRRVMWSCGDGCCSNSWGEGVLLDMSITPPTELDDNDGDNWASPSTVEGWLVEAADKRGIDKSDIEFIEGSSRDDGEYQDWNW